MTKSIITLILTFYSAARVSAIAYYLYYQIEKLPMGVLLITSACCLVCFGAAVAHYKGRLMGKTLKSVLMLVAAAALANMLILFLNPVNDLANLDLLITGTLLDVVFYLGVLSLRLPDSSSERGQRRGKGERSSPQEEEELDQLVDQIGEEQG